MSRRKKQPPPTRRKLSLKVVSDGTIEGTALADAETGEVLEIDGHALVSALYQTPRQSWEVPPEINSAGVEVKKGTPAPAVSEAQVVLTFTGVPVEAPEGTGPFSLHGVGS